METPGANAAAILLEATQEDSPSPEFYFYNSPTNKALYKRTWSLGSEGVKDCLEFNQPLSSPEIFMFLSHEISLADQLEAILHFQNSNNQITMGRILLFIHAPVLLEGITSLQEWLDAVVHF